VQRAAATAVLGLTLAVVAVGCGSGAKTAADTGSPAAGTTSANLPNPGTRTNKGDAACQSVPHPGGLKAVFARRSTAAAAEALRTQAEGRGFQGLDIEEQGCGNFYVTLPGLADAKQFAAFKAEAKSAGFDVTLRCEPPPVQDTGDLVAVFGLRRTHRLAVGLKRLVVGRGFISAEIRQESCNQWSVFVEGIKPGKTAKDFAAEARSAGFKVTFEPS
jgi:hypothetical protein